MHHQIRTRLATAALGAAALAASLAPAAAHADAAAPFITVPGVQAQYDGNTAYFTARVHCGQWKGIAALTIGTQGVRVLTQSKYICERATDTVVHFAISGGQLPVTGRYQYTLYVGRHDAGGHATRWTHSLSGFFTKY